MREGVPPGIARTSTTPRVARWLAGLSVRCLALLHIAYRYVLAEIPGRSFTAVTVTLSYTLLRLRQTLVLFPDADSVNRHEEIRHLS